MVTGVVEAGGEVFDGLLAGEGDGLTRGEGELFPFEDFGGGGAAFFDVVEGVVDDEALGGGGGGLEVEGEADLLA